MSEKPCISTGKPCGTDTVLIGRECSANDGVCIRRLERQRDALVDALREYVAAQDEYRGFDWESAPPRVDAACARLDAAEGLMRALLAELDESNQRKEVK